MEDSKLPASEPQESKPPASAPTEDSTTKPAEAAEMQPVRKSARKRVPNVPASPPTSPPPKRRKKKPQQSKSKPKAPSSPSPYSSGSEDTSDMEDDDGSYQYGPMSWDPAGVYAPLLRLRHKRQLDCTPVIPLPPHTVGGVRDQLEKHKACNCRRSNCLKLYCDCFQAGLHCHSSCNCVSCMNKADVDQRQRNLSIDVALLRNPNSFRPRLANVMVDPRAPPVRPNGSPSKAGNAGCHCKKSFCLKKYCECFQSAVYCSALHCRCVQCQNRPGNPERERLIKLRRAQEMATAQAAAEAHQLSRISGRMAMMGEAGRTYFHHQQPDADSEDMEASTAAAAVAAGAVAGGVDLFLPPSAHTTPLTLKGGMPYAGLAFASSGGPPKQSWKSKKRSPPKRREPNLKWETDLQRLWRIEASRAHQTFHTVELDLDRRIHPARIIPRPNVVDPVALYRARATMTSLETDMQDIMAAVHKAEATAVSYLDTKKEEEYSPLQEAISVSEQASESVAPEPAGEVGMEALFSHETLPALDDDALVDKEAKQLDVDDAEPSEGAHGDVEMDSSGLSAPDDLQARKESALEDGAPLKDSTPVEPDESLLLCDEKVDDSDEHKLSEDAVRQLTILAAQETAMLSQLALIIRRKTLAMTKQRLDIVEKARNK